MTRLTIEMSANSRLTFTDLQDMPKMQTLVLTILRDENLNYAILKIAFSAKEKIRNFHTEWQFFAKVSEMKNFTLA